MKTLIRKRYIIKQNLIAIIGFCLCFYFSYHAMLGERSYLRLITLEREVAKVEAEYEVYYAQRSALERRVVMLRPGSIDPDLLEERARYVLGYARPDERLVFGVN